MPLDGQLGAVRPVRTVGLNNRIGDLFIGSLARRSESSSGLNLWITESELLSLNCRVWIAEFGLLSLNSRISTTDSELPNAIPFADTLSELSPPPTWCVALPTSRNWHLNGLLNYETALRNRLLSQCRLAFPKMAFSFDPNIEFFSSHTRPHWPPGCP